MSGDVGAQKKVLQLIVELSEHPYRGTGQPEALKNDLAGYWSRRVSERHRLVYTVDERRRIVFIFSILGHY